MSNLIEFSLLRQMKKNYALIPIVVVGAFGVALAATQTVRTLMQSPDIKLNRLSAAKPYDKYLKSDGKYVQYKYFSTMDYNKMEVDPDRPSLWESCNHYIYQIEQIKY